MRKDELLRKMAEDSGISQAAAGKAFDSFIDSVQKSLKKKNGIITLAGFGTFKKIYRKTRQGHNPRTGEIMKIKGRNVVRFSPGKKLRESIA